MAPPLETVIEDEEGEEARSIASAIPEEAREILLFPKCSYSTCLWAPACLSPRSL